MSVGVANGGQSFGDCSGSRMDRPANGKGQESVDSSRRDSGSCVEESGILSRSCVVWGDGLSAVSFSDDGSRRRKTFVSGRRVSWHLAGVFGDWTWTFDCMSLVNLEDREGRTGESWLGRAFSSLVSIRSDCEADGTDRTLCPI